MVGTIVSLPGGRTRYDARHEKFALIANAPRIYYKNHADFDQDGQVRRYRPQSTLFLDGQETQYIYAIRSGMLRLVKTLPDGRRQILGFVLAGDLLGLTLPIRHAFGAETITEVELRCYECDDFIKHIERRPDLLQKLHALTAGEVLSGQEQMFLLGRLRAKEKVASFLLTMRKRYRARGDKGDLYVHLPMTREDIGDYLGLTLETVSRMLAKMARDKIICIVPNGIRLIMLDKLEALVLQ